MVTFQRCNCDPAPHGYLYKDGYKLPVIIISVAAARYLVDEIKEEETDLIGREQEIEEQARVAGLPENADNEIEIVNEDIEYLAFVALLSESSEDADFEALL